jgi:hypothetical protein
MRNEIRRRAKIWTLGETREGTPKNFEVPIRGKPKPRLGLAQRKTARKAIFRVPRETVDGKPGIERFTANRKRCRIARRKGFRAVP